MSEPITERAKAIAATEMERLLQRTTASKALYERAVQSMPGGVASSFQLGDPGPVVVLFEPPVASIRLFFGVELRFGDPR